MRPPRVRFTLRRMMVVVAVVAILLGIGEMLRRSFRFETIGGDGPPQIESGTITLPGGLGSSPPPIPSSAAISKTVTHEL